MGSVGRRAALVVSSFVVTLGFPLLAHAGNDSSFLIGGRAAAMGGAYTALHEDAAALWYNPAALAYNDRYSLDASASAYSLSVGKSPGFMVTHLPSGTKSADYAVSSIQIVPTSLTFAWNLGQWKRERPVESASSTASSSQSPPSPISHSLAFSVFVPRAQRINTTLTTSTEEPGLSYFSRMRINVVATEYYLGPSYAIRWGDFLALGASLFAVYTKSEGSSGFDIHAADATGEAFGVMSADHRVSTIGVGGALGVQLRPHRNLFLGLAFRLPTLMVYQSLDVGQIGASAGPNVSPQFQDQTVSESKATLGQSTPMSIRAGIAWVSPGRALVSLDASRSFDFSDGTLGIREKGVTNVRAGAEFRLSDMYTLGVGAFTDFSPSPSIANFGDASIDYFGGTFGLTRIQTFDVDRSPKTDRLAFSLSAVVKYAYGAGRAGGYVIEPAQGRTTLAEVDATFHDLSLTVSSGVRF